MKAFVTTLFLSVLVGSSNPARKSQQNYAQPLTYSTKSYVLAEPVHGRNLKISISAKEKSLYIVNCNQFIVVAPPQTGFFEPHLGWRIGGLPFRKHYYPCQIDTKLYRTYWKKCARSGYEHTIQSASLWSCSRSGSQVPAISVGINDQQRVQAYSLAGGV